MDCTQRTLENLLPGMGRRLCQEVLLDKAGALLGPFKPSEGYGKRGTHGPGRMLGQSSGHVQDLAQWSENNGKPLKMLSCQWSLECFSHKDVENR